MPTVLNYSPAECARVMQSFPSDGTPVNDSILTHEAIRDAFRMPITCKVDGHGYCLNVNRGNVLRAYADECDAVGAHGLARTCRTAATDALGGQQYSDPIGPQNAPRGPVYTYPDAVMVVATYPDGTVAITDHARMLNDGRHVHYALQYGSPIGPENAPRGMVGTLSPEYLHAVALEGFFDANRGATLADAVSYAFASTPTDYIAPNGSRVWSVDPHSEPTADEVKVVRATVRAMQSMLDSTAVPINFVRILCASVNAYADLGI